MSMLVIDIEDLRSGSRTVSGPVTPEELFPAGLEELRFSGSLDLDIRVSTTDQLTFYVNGQVSYVVIGECRRCLKEVSQPRTSEIRGVFSTPQAIEKMDLDEEERELEGISLLEADQKTFDLRDLIKEDIILDYPQFLLCSEDCKGLCPVCGGDLNLNRCGCDLKNDDSRWAKLNELKKKM
jgi:uncharacterized protein